MLKYNETTLLYYESTISHSTENSTSEYTKLTSVSFYTLSQWSDLTYLTCCPLYITLNNNNQYYIHRKTLHHF
jgi:hypothetical protein